MFLTMHVNFTTKYIPEYPRSIVSFLSDGQAFISIIAESAIDPVTLLHDNQISKQTRVEVDGLSQTHYRQTHALTKTIEKSGHPTFLSSCNLFTLPFSIFLEKLVLHLMNSYLSFQMSMPYLLYLLDAF